MRQHTSAYVSIRQHQHSKKLVAFLVSQGGIEEASVIPQTLAYESIEEATPRRPPPS